MPCLNLLTRATLATAHHLPLLRGHGNLSSKACALAIKAGAEPECIVHMRLGYRAKLDLRSLEQRHAATSRQYDDANVLLLRRLVRPGACALDVGANVGLYSIPLALRVPVYAFEPDRRNFARLAENLALNPAAAPNLHLFNLGLSSSIADVTMYEHPFPMNCSIVDRPAEFATANIAHVEPLDAIWDPRIRIDAIKIDIEGHDAQFLLGARDTLSRNRPILQMEINRWYYQRRGENFDSLIPSLLPPAYLIFQMRQPETRLSIRSKLTPPVLRESLAGREGEAFFVPAERRDEFLSAF